MRKSIFIAMVVFLALLTINVFAAGQRAASGNTIKLALAFPMTGDNAEYGQSFLTASQIIVERYNNSGGVLGRQVELVVYDDRNQPDEAASIAQRIVSDRDIIGVLGHFSSGVSMAASPAYQENQVIQISNTASHPDYSKAGNFIFRNNTVIDAEIRAITDVLANNLNLSRIGIIAIRTDWGTTAGNIAARLVNAHPRLTLVAHEEVLETSDDHSPAIARLRANGAEAVIAVGMYSLYGPLARQYREVDPNIRIMGMSNAYTQQIIQLGGRAVEGLIAPVSFFAGADNPEARYFVTEFTRRFGMEPSALAAQAYDSVGIFLEAIKQAGSLDRQAVRNAVQNIVYPGITGMTRFDAQGDADKVFQMVIIREGRFVPFN